MIETKRTSPDRSSEERRKLVSSLEFADNARPIERLLTKSGAQFPDRVLRPAGFQPDATPSRPGLIAKKCNSGLDVGAPSRPRSRILRAKAGPPMSEVLD
ncbi:MAG: hypothetical protein APF80_16150 [Alphaproteobacteria bacterium BRH_c36]|nr:MAG: hypothetical protein APF80_16150 [Alphaproteobacteria bacterium BRH_c36]